MNSFLMSTSPISITKDADYDRLAMSANAEMNPDARNKIWKQAQQVIHDHYLVGAVWEAASIYGVSKRLEYNPQFGENLDLASIKIRQNSRVPLGPGAAHPVLSVTGLNVTFRSRRGLVPAVRDVSFDIARGEVFAIIGESGSGKSSIAMAMMGVLPPSALVTGQIRLAGIDLASLSGTERRRICGERVSLISQDALASLNPCTTVGYQIAEMLMVHRGMARRVAMAEAVRLLALTGVPSPEKRVNDYPHQFSGGMRQRALIAISLALQPDLVIADEPTTALDATIKAQILQLLTRLRAELGMSILLITHDMGVVAKMADRMLVMYAGRPWKSER